jgi:hypothetical protein
MGAGSTSGATSGSMGTGAPSYGGSGQGASGQGASSQTAQALSNAASQAGNKVVSTLDSQKNRAADGLGSVAQALRQTGDQLRNQNQGAPFNQYVGSAADQIDRLSSYLRSTNAREMVRNVEDFARRQPALFIGGAFMLGLLGARFLKSSAQTDPSQGD